MFSATDQICNYWDKLEVFKHPRGGGAKAIYLFALHSLLSEPGKPARWTVIGDRFRSPLNYKPRAWSPKPTLQVSRREEPTRTRPGLQLRAHPQPCPEGDAQASPPAASPSRPRPGPASPWTLSGTSVPVARPRPRSTGNNGGGVAGACVAGSTRSCTGGSASPLSSSGGAGSR